MTKPKPKDKPRFKVSAQIEADFKTAYSDTMGAMMKHVLTRLNDFSTPAGKAQPSTPGRTIQSNT